MDLRICKISFLLGIISVTSIQAQNQDCNGAAMTTHESYLYGRFETVMKSAAGDGIVSSFFLYNNNTNCNYPAENNEIDVEMTGNDQQIYFTTHHPDPVQSWGYGQNFYLGFNPHETYQKYIIEWEPDIVRWFVNDQLIYTQTVHATNLHYPMGILMNLWASISESWVGVWDSSILPRQSSYDYVKYYSYTPGQGDSGTGNNFTFEWEDNFDTLDTTRWKIRDFRSFDNNYCTFRATNITTNDGKLQLTIDEPIVNTEIIPVTFSINVEELSLQPTDIVYLNGQFNNWCGSCMPMTQNGEIWELTIDLEPSDYQYLFTINGWEQIGRAPLGSECDFKPCDEFQNYGLIVPSGSSGINLDTVCWEKCSDCDNNTLSTSNYNFTKNKGKVIKIFDMLGREVEENSGKILFYLYENRTIEKKVILQQ